jgi:carboxymethylenebutenolidase
MSGETIDITAPGGVADAYIARPDAGTAHAGVMLMHDAFGLRPQIERMADRIAAHGYVVLAPNLYYREGRMPLFDTGAISDPERRTQMVRETLMPLIAGLAREVIVRDAGAYLDALSQHGRAPFGVSGYCMGGRAAWWVAAAYPDRVAALGCFHAGHLATEGSDSPHLLAGDLRAELFLGHADNDDSMTAENIAAVDDALDAAGVPYRSELFEGAAHGYTMADSVVYDEAAAERHFSELLALLDRTIAAEPASR